jgi:hypothetical protein
VRVSGEQVIATEGTVTEIDFDKGYAILQRVDAPLYLPLLSAFYIELLCIEPTCLSSKKHHSRCSSSSSSAATNIWANVRTGGVVLNHLPRELSILILVMVM